MRKSQSELFWGGGSIGSKNFGVLYYFYSVVFLYPFFVIYVDRTKARFHFCQVLKCEPQSEGYSLNMHVFSVSKLAVKPCPIKGNSNNRRSIYRWQKCSQFCTMSIWRVFLWTFCYWRTRNFPRSYWTFVLLAAVSQASILLKHLKHMQPFT